MNPEAEKMLIDRGIRPTAVRLLILDKMIETGTAMSQADVERLIETVDKSSVSRTLNAFVDGHLAHRFTGSDGLTLYALCPEWCRCHDPEGPVVDHTHAHFTCERCGRTFCLRNMPLPELQLPDGYRMLSASYLVRGVCPDCSAQGL